MATRDSAGNKNHCHRICCAVHWRLLDALPRVADVKRNPAGWFYYWPTILWDHGPYMRDRDFIGSLLVNVLVYSLLAYFVLRLLKMRKTMT